MEEIAISTKKKYVIYFLRISFWCMHLKEKKQPLRRNSTTNQSSWRMVCWSFPLACRGASAPWGPACSCSLSLIHEFNSIKFTSSKTSWRCCAPFLFFNHISLFLFSINYFIPFIIDGREKEERSFLCFPSSRSLLINAVSYN